MYDKVFNADMKLCGFFNKACHYTMIKKSFSVISRLGNGIFWYALMILLPFIYGFSATLVVLQMAIAGLSGSLIYYILKRGIERPRPYVVNDLIKLGTQPLDQFSFPSGHTLHAVGFSTIVCFYYPEFILVLLPVTALIAISRMLLGLHYPSDVLVGAGIGLLMAILILNIFN